MPATPTSRTFGFSAITSSTSRIHAGDIPSIEPAIP
jgi:hypothetical protein